MYLSFTQALFSQQDSLNSKRLKTVIGLETLAYTGVMTNLYILWYADYESSGFHTLNDNSSWMQMDKIGHSVTSFYVGKAGYEVLKWSGVNKKKSILYGGSLGLFFLTSVEVLDGFSSEWGYSWGDVAANSAGTALFMSQQLAWDEQRILLKFSFHQSKYAELRPSLLGEDIVQQVIKDYNGQTYWMSANIASFLGKDTRFPKWLNFAVGYGANGMVGSIKNTSHPEIKRYRQYYVSFDIDLTRIKTKSKFANTLLGTFGFLKFPLPTVEFNSGGSTKFYGVYF